jgi:leader peptidase (prepilin peptidase)/N-methyltransferase
MADSGIFDPLPALWPWLALAAGLVVGSFANVCIHRLPERRSVVVPRSRCPRCDAPIRAVDNVPVLSWLALRGRCRACRAPISARYPLVEAANAALFFGVARIMGPTPRAAVAMALVTALLVLSLIDYDHQILPDAITLPGIAVGLAASLLPGPPTPLAAAAAAAGGYLAFWAVAKAYERTRGIEGLGQGDWKMAAMLGAFLGWDKLLLAVFAATLCGTAVGLALMALSGRSSRHPLPLGTFLGAAGIGVVLAGDPVLEWYRGLLHV